MRSQAFLYGMGYVTIFPSQRDFSIIRKKYSLYGDDEKLKLWNRWVNIGLTLTPIVTIFTILLMAFLIIAVGDVFIILIIIPVGFQILTSYSQLRDWSKT